MMLKRYTDLAMEAATLSGTAPMAGVTTTVQTKNGVEVTVVEVTSPTAAETLGKPMGRYVTLDLTPLARREADAFSRIAQVLAGEIVTLLPPGNGPVLVVGLGNRAITPDNIGPLAQSHVLVTRHLVTGAPEHFGAFRPVAALAAGVLGSTGVESGELVAAVVSRIKPACVIAIDALAARSLSRLCTTVQLGNTGIAPGSGVGNHRTPLDKDSLGVPVLALGIPTVVDGATLCADLLEEVGRGDVDPETLGGKGSNFFVTPRDIDRQVAEGGRLLGVALTLALQPGLTVEDVEVLMG